MSRLRRFLNNLGPGFITGAADDDPSGIATYAQTGSYFGTMQAWTALWMFPFMTAIQEIAGRIGMVTGKGLAGVMKRNYPAPLVYSAVFLLVFANVVNIGADMGAMAESAHMLVGMEPKWWMLVFTALTLYLEIIVSYRGYARYLKYLAFSLLAYVVTALLVTNDWVNVLYQTLVPHVSWSREYLINLVALLGTTFSPYLFFWQASEEVEEEVAHHELRTMGRGSPHLHPGEVKNIGMDTAVGMFFSNLVMFFIIVATAMTIGRHGGGEITSAAQAAETLRPIAGDFAYLLFAVGIISTGLLAVPILAGSASYAVAELMGWREGLYRTYEKAPAFYGVIILSTFAGLFINFIHLSAFRMLYVAAIINGLTAPLLMMFMMRISSNPKIMGTYTNSMRSNILGWTITLVMLVAALALWLM